MKYLPPLVLCLTSLWPLHGQSVNWTDWTSVASDDTAAAGTLLVNGTTPTTVSVSGCVAGTVTDGTSNVFADSSLFSPAIASGDALRTDHIGNTMGPFTITFSNPVTNPIFHMADRHHYNFSATDVSDIITYNTYPIEFQIVSGNLDYTNSSHTGLKRNDWTLPFIQAGNSNGVGTTADGTFYMLGTFTQIRLELPLEDFIYFQIGDDSYVVPEPGSALMTAVAGLLLLRRKR